MKILYIITQADGGGAQKYVLSLAKYFNGAIASGSEAATLFEDAKKAGVQTFRLSRLKRAILPIDDFMAMWEIRQLIKNYAPDIVHLNSTKAGVLGSFAAIGLKTKIVFTAHGFIFNEPMSWFKKSFYLALEKVASSYRNYIICVSEADHKSALDNNLISADKISTIHNGIPPINFLSHEDAKKELGLPLDKKIIGAIANDYKTKGLDVLAKALENPIAECQTVVIGKVSDKSNKNITYLGFKDSASLYLKAFDILVIPSRKEGFPFVVLEGMQAGLPIIATEVGGIPEALDDAGILIEPENPQELAVAIKNLIADNKKQKILSHAALERSKLFTEEKMLEETKKVYEKLSQ